MKKLVIVSGHFNPLHVGHMKMIREAKKLGDKLVVIVNNDVQQELKKGKIINKEHDRMDVVDSLQEVDEVFLAVDETSSVIGSIDIVAKYHSGWDIIFANGGDRDNVKVIPEAEICKKHSIKLMFGVGGDDKYDSSSRINRDLGFEKSNK